MVAGDDDGAGEGGRSVAIPTAQVGWTGQGPLPLHLFLHAIWKAGEPGGNRWRVSQVPGSVSEVLWAG